MDPIAFTIFGLDIRWYGILISLGVIAALFLGSITTKITKASYDEILNMFFVAFPAGIFGARLYYVIFQFEDYKDDLIQVFNIRQGGLAIHGGLIFAVTAVFIYTKYKKLSFAKYMDTVAPCIILAQGIGRWGNFFNSEAHGGPVSYEFISKFPSFIQKGMHIEGVYYHPTFLYESIWNLLVCIFLFYILKKRPKEGIVLTLYIGLYSLGRFFIEGLRTDSLMLGSLRVAQLVSLSGIIFSIIFIIYSYKKSTIKID